MPTEAINHGRSIAEKNQTLDLSAAMTAIVCVCSAKVIYQINHTAVPTRARLAPYFFHMKHGIQCNDVTWGLKHIKSPHTRLFVQQLVQKFNKNLDTSYYRHCVEIRWISSHKRSVMRKVFPCRDVINICIAQQFVSPIYTVFMKCFFDRIMQISDLFRTIVLVVGCCFSFKIIHRYHVVSGTYCSCLLRNALGIYRHFIRIHIKPTGDLSILETMPDKRSSSWRESHTAI